MVAPPSHNPLKPRFDSDGFPLKGKKKYYMWQVVYVISSINFFPFSLNADLVLSNKLVVYDLEKQGIGWVEYNCKYFELFHYFSFIVWFHD